MGVIILEEIINQVISIDNEAKAIISEMESKEENLGYFINNTLKPIPILLLFLILL